jgi:hypothetical protein
MANATASLTSTTFSVTVEPSDTRVLLASTSGISPGVRLYAGRELLGIEVLTGIGNEAIVRRGLEGTAASRHATNETVWIGRADQFSSSDPTGLPPAVLLVYPYINVLTGVAWVAQGDETGPGNAGRIWAPMTVAMSAGALGNQQTTTTVPSS